MQKNGLRRILREVARLQIEPHYRNRDRVKAKLTWDKTKWGARDIWSLK